MPSRFSNIVFKVWRLMGFGSSRFEFNFFLWRLTGFRSSITEFICFLWRLMGFRSSITEFICFLWRLVGFGSSIAGFICFALGPSFQKLFGGWNLLKIVVYCILSSMFSLFILCANRFRRRFPRVFLLKALVSFLVLLFTSLYSYYDDLACSKDGEREGKGHRNILSLISFGSFALMSVSLSIQLQPGFEVGMSNFFLGCLVVGVVKKNLLEGLGVALLCFIVMSIRYYSDFRQEQRRRGGVEQEDIAVDGDGLHGETPQIFILPSSPTVHPSSDSTFRHRTVLNTPEDIVVGSELEDFEVGSELLEAVMSISPERPFLKS